MRHNNFRRFYEQQYPKEENYLHLLDYASLFRMKLISKIVGDVKGKMVVDIGCGNGSVSFLLSFLGATVTSVDVSMRALQATRSLKSASKRNAQFKPDLSQGEATRLPFREETFDIVCCLETLQHSPYDKIAMNEIARVTKPRGMVIVSVPHDANVTGKEKLPEHYKRYSLETLKERLCPRQLRLKRVVFWRFPVLELLELIRVRNVFAALGLLIEVLSSKNSSFHKCGSLQNHGAFLHQLLVFYRTKFWRKLALPLLLHILDLNMLFQNSPCSDDVFLIYIKTYSIKDRN
jgi:ubiquinone/menaquinone biosynthesis C-methylase UbiE